MSRSYVEFEADMGSVDINITNAEAKRLIAEWELQEGFEGEGDIMGWYEKRGTGFRVCFRC